MPNAPAAWRRDLKDMLAMMKGLVQPFYADMEKDKNTTVLDFVEKIETVMAHARPAAVPLDDGALIPSRGNERVGQRVSSPLACGHANGHGTDVACQAHRTATRHKEDAHAHRAGESVRLHRAPHIYPASAIGDTRDHLMLATSWATIISLSQSEMHKHIVATLPPRSLAE